MHIEAYTEKKREEKDYETPSSSIKKNRGLVLFPTAQAPIV